MLHGVLGAKVGTLAVPVSFRGQLHTVRCYLWESKLGVPLIRLAQPACGGVV